MMFTKFDQCDYCLKRTLWAIDEKIGFECVFSIMNENTNRTIMQIEANHDCAKFVPMPIVDDNTDLNCMEII